MVVVSSSAKHLQSQHPCERGAARVKQHFCPVRLSLALHSLQHHLIGLPFSSIKFPGCKKSTEKQKAHLGDGHQRKQLGLFQAGNMHSHHSSQSCQETLHWDLQQGPAPKAALQKLSGEQQICSERLLKSNYLAAKTTGQQGAAVASICKLFTHSVTVPHTNSPI